MLKFPLVDIETPFSIRIYFTQKPKYVNPKERKYDNSISENNIFYYELGSKPNVDILGITVSMYKQHNFETIFTSNNIMNIQYAIGKVFGSW